MAAIQYHRAFLRQRLLREQYPLTLNALYFRFWTPGKGHFLDEVLKNILCGRLRVVARWAAPWRDREAFVNAAGIKACCIRYAKDGTACLVPKKLVSLTTRTRFKPCSIRGKSLIQTSDSRKRKPPNYGRCAVARMETNGEERKSSTIGSLGMRQNAPIGCVG